MIGDSARGAEKLGIFELLEGLLKTRNGLPTINWFSRGTALHCGHYLLNPDFNLYNVKPLKKKKKKVPKNIFLNEQIHLT